SLTGSYGLKPVGALDYYGLTPIASLEFPDPTLPVKITLRAFSPLIPHDLKNSSLPGIVFIFDIKNEVRAPVEAAVALSWENLSGVGGSAATGRISDRTGDTLAIASLPVGFNGARMLRQPVSQAPQTDRLRYNARGEYALVAHPTSSDTIVTTAGFN